MSVYRKIKSLYNQLPPIDIPCIQCCNNCCQGGAIPWSHPELEVLLAHNGGIFPSVKNDCCCFSTDVGCSIYEYRPFMCRIWGLVQSIGLQSCAHGLRTTKPLTDEKVQELMDKYFKLVNKTGGTFIPYGAEEIVEELMKLRPNVRWADKSIQLLNSIE